MISKSKIVILLVIFFVSFTQFYIKGERYDSTTLPKVEILGREYYVYEVQKGETMYGIAKKFGWDMEELLSSNPELKAKLEKGIKVYYPAGNLSDYVNDPDSGLDGFLTHTVKKGETIYSIARNYDVPLNIIYKYNPEASRGVKPGMELHIPPFSISRKELTDISIPKREDVKLENSRSQYPKVVDSDVESSHLYITNKETDDTFTENDSIPLNLENPVKYDRVKVALILDDPNSNKDIDFARGMLISLSQMKEMPFKIDLKVFDGRVSAIDLTSELDNFDPSLIMTTADKTFPLFLVDWGNTNDVAVVNVFDLKNDLYEENNSIIQILLPSQFYNAQIANEIYLKNSNRKLLTVGDQDPNDGLAIELLKLYGNNAEKITLEEFGSIEPDIMEPVLIYSYANKKEEVSDFLNNLTLISENYIGFDFHILGRPSWIAMVDDFGDKFNEFEVLIPSRVWIEDDTDEWKIFNAKYEEMFDSAPVRSIPNFAASGYDMTEFFIPYIAEKKLKLIPYFNYDDKKFLQTDFNLNRLNGEGGLINEISYLIKFNSVGGKEKFTVR